MIQLNFNNFIFLNSHYKFIKVNNDNINDSCPPQNYLYESAPLPFQEENQLYNNNNNICNSINFENKFNNQININRISESPEDFSVLNNINSL